MTIEHQIKKDLKERKEVLNNILAEFEEFDIKNFKYEISKDYEFVNFRVQTISFFFDFRIDLMNDKLVILAYTHKQLTNISCCGEYPLTMANIDELLMSIKSYENVRVPNFN